MPRLFRLAAVAALGLLAGCSSLDTSPPHDGLLLPTAVLVASQNGYLTVPALGAAVAAYAVLDPLAPNWSIREVRQGEDRYRLHLRMRALHSGGDGEAHQVFVRRAAQLAAQPGYSSYEVVAWQSGLESTRPFSHLVAEGEVRLIRTPPPATGGPAAPNKPPLSPEPLGYMGL